LLLALSLILSYAPLCPKAGAQAQSTDQARSQDQTVTKPNAQAGQKQPAPSEKQIEKVMHDVFNVGVGQRMTVFLRNGDTLHGTLAQIREETFEVSEVDMRQTLTVRYDEVKKIRGGYGGVNLFTGKTTNAPPRGVRIALFSGLAFLLALPIIMIATSKN
jgi:hypothetical protein